MVENNFERGIKTRQKAIDTIVCVEIAMKNIPF
jgi:hypothetical protein